MLIIEIKILNMKFTYIIMILLFTSCNNVNQSNKVLKDTGNHKKTLSVNEEKKISITQDSTYVKTINYFEESSEGGSISYFIKNNELVKIKVKIYGLLGSIEKIYELNGQKLVIYKENTKRYNQSIYRKEDFKIIDSSKIFVKYDKNEEVKIIKSDEEIDSIKIQIIANNIKLNKNRYLKIMNKK